MISALVSRLIILSFGNLYPAYASYKAVRTKNVKEYVKWMMYWIVFAFFTCIETVTDIFLSWFPFYYEIKVVLVLWLLSPATKGSSTLYRKFVHPMLTRREQEIDEYLYQAKERGYSAVLQLGSKGVNYATNIIMQTAIKGGGNLVQTIQRSYSLSDLTESNMQQQNNNNSNTNIKEQMIVSCVQRSQQKRNLPTRIHSPHSASERRSSSRNRYSTGMYYAEMDGGAASRRMDNLLNDALSDDISSGYSTSEAISNDSGFRITSSNSSTVTGSGHMNTTSSTPRSKRSKPKIYRIVDLTPSSPSSSSRRNQLILEKYLYSSALNDHRSNVSKFNSLNSLQNFITFDCDNSNDDDDGTDNYISYEDQKEIAPYDYEEFDSKNKNQNDNDNDIIGEDEFFDSESSIVNSIMTQDDQRCVDDINLANRSTIIANNANSTKEECTSHSNANNDSNITTTIISTTTTPETKVLKNLHSASHIEQKEHDSMCPRIKHFNSKSPTTSRSYMHNKGKAPAIPATVMIQQENKTAREANSKETEI